MTTPIRFALIISIGAFSGANAALATGVGEAVVSDAAERVPAGAASVVEHGANTTVEVGGEAWRIRRAKNPLGSIVLVRNETDAPLSVSIAGEDGPAHPGDPVPPGGAKAQRCEVGRTTYPLAVASEAGERVLDAQLQCGDSVVVQLPERAAVGPLEAVNEAWALPPGESAAAPLDMAEEH